MQVDLSPYDLLRLRVDAENGRPLAAEDARALLDLVNELTEQVDELTFEAEELMEEVEGLEADLAAARGKDVKAAP